jgi:hypothetical protein
MLIAGCAAALAISGCTTERHSLPSRTATEELLISSAADRAAQNLNLSLPTDRKLYVDSSNFEGPDSKYAISAIKSEILRRGGRLVSDREDADIIVEIALGALSIDQTSSILGLPQFDLPIPTAGDLAFPEIALFKKEEHKGIAKFSAFGYDAKTGALVASGEPDIGTSHKTQWVVAFFISWNTNNITPKPKKDSNNDYFYGSPIPMHQKDLPGWL